MLLVIGPWQDEIPPILVANVNLLCLIDVSLATSAITSDENHVFNVVNVPVGCVCVICSILVLYNLKIWYCGSFNWTCLLCCLRAVESICDRSSSVVSISE